MAAVAEFTGCPTMNSPRDHPDRLLQRDLPLGGWTARPLHRADARFVLELLADPDVTRARSVPPPRGEAEADAWIRAGMELGDFRWAIERDEDRAFAGMVVLQGVRRDPGVAEAGYLLLPDARGRGVATAALEVVTVWAFRELVLERVWLVHDIDNQASCNVARRAGFRHEEVAATPRRRIDGSDVGQEIHARYRDEVPA